jgi:sigma-B regulation protein RsbU (phosphoserine phosphatase)
MNVKCFRPSSHKWIEEQNHNQFQPRLAKRRQPAMSLTADQSHQGGPPSSVPGEFFAGPTRRSKPSEPPRSPQDQLHRAGRLQRSLLPNIGGPLGGYRLASAYYPCEALAGDFYDIFRDAGTVMLIVADVMGHGAEAALITMLVKAVFQETARHIGETNALLTEMNERLFGLIPVGSFAAATVVRLDPDRSKIEISNAGLPYPFVLRASTRSVHKVRLRGVPLGLNLSSGYQGYDVLRVQLAPDDVLLVTSDGICSIKGDDGRSFEDRRLGLALTRLTGVAGEKVIETLVAEALEFSHGRPFLDDINLVAVCRDHDPAES